MLTSTTPLEARSPDMICVQEGRHIVLDPRYQENVSRFEKEKEEIYGDLKHEIARFWKLKYVGSFTVVLSALEYATDKVQENCWLKSGLGF